MTIYSFWIQEGCKPVYMPSMHAVFVQGFEKNIDHICNFFQNSVLVTGLFL